MTLLLLLGLAVARATRLWRDDWIMETPREWVASFLEYESDDFTWRSAAKDWLAALLECPWCLSAWLSAAAVIFADSATSRSVAVPFISWLAVWWVACTAYFVLELVSDWDALAWQDRKDRDIA